MDGVGTVSHCPINPGETFQYRLKYNLQSLHYSILEKLSSQQINHQIFIIFQKLIVF